MRSLRFRTATTAATTALVAALALTACGQSDDAADAKPQAASSATSTSTSTDEAGNAGDDKQPSGRPSANSVDESTDKSGSTGGSHTADKTSDVKEGSGSAGSKATGTCTSADTKITVTKVSRPLNHLLVTATNTGSATCHAYYAPLLGFDEPQAVTQINENSKPQAVVTLSPGQSAYASIALGGVDGAEMTPAYKLSVHFAGRDNQGSEGPATHLTLPKGTSTTADTSVSYWQATMADALVW